MNSANNHSTAERQTQAYDHQFFSGSAAGSRSSSQAVLGLLAEVYSFQSVLDVGCGQGAWLATAETLGASRLVGFDGPWVDRSALLSERIDFRPANLETDFAPSERFDLCISVEVAEHLAPSAANRFVQNLCAAADVIVFSSAIRLQGGVLHVNEQWQSYWTNLFAEFGYRCHDVFRPTLWTNPRVDSWYRQNAFLYIQNSHPLNDVLAAKPCAPTPLDVVHPEIYEGNIDSYKRLIESPTLKVCCDLLGRWGRRQITKLVSR